MPIAKAHAISLLGLSGTPVQVEADISANLPAFVLVGLPDASLSEATSRVRSACSNSGFPFPARKITVNLSPASVPKSGSSFDLAIAVSILAAMEALPASAIQGTLFIGELGLDGHLSPVRGVVPMVLAARNAGFQKVVVPEANLGEALLVENIRSYGFKSLQELVSAVRDTGGLPDSNGSASTVARTNPNNAGGNELDLSQVIGQPVAVSALITAAAGGHHLAMSGSPGAGKTMLAERLPTILPRLSMDQALEVAAVESLVGHVSQVTELDQRPRFQAPHHTSSVAAIVGGGKGLPRPGAVSQAHRGVLFLDEALEFQSSVLESLREPLESGRVVIHRSAGSAEFPAKFQLVLASNPCPCGFFGSVKRDCTCSVLVRRRYESKISGPLYDRIDIRLSISAVSLSANLGMTETAPSSQDARNRIMVARQAAFERLKGLPYQLNAQVPGVLLRGRFSPGKQSLRLLDRQLQTGKTSMRGFDRCLRLAWTIADLEGATVPTADHVALALLLRGSDERDALR
jgi:magnesium chelatase family protein